MNVLLTGGLGYIGSHAAVELVANGHEIFIYDNLSNSKLSTLEKLNEITGKKIISADNEPIMSNVRFIIYFNTLLITKFIFE